ncbi:MAG: hypothetical protein QME51_00555 [Planctomycetota bacterium]|nr:hypothetical protein [Planctomycetota bacterium]
MVKGHLRNGQGAFAKGSRGICERVKGRLRKGQEAFAKWSGGVGERVKSCPPPKNRTDLDVFLDVFVANNLCNLWPTCVSSVAK